MPAKPIKPNEDGNDALGTKLHKALDKALKEAKKIRMRDEELVDGEPRTKKDIVISALRNWLETHAGKTDDDGFHPRPMRGGREAQGKEDLNISMPKELLDTVKAEAGRRKDDEIKPESVRSLVESALTEWLLQNDFKDLLTWIEPGKKAK